MCSFIFSVGTKIIIIEDGTEIDRAIVCSVVERAGREVVEVQGSSGKVFFGIFGANNTWKVLFLDPMTEELCFSEEGPLYELKII